MSERIQVLDVEAVRSVRCEVCRQSGSRSALKLGTVHLARSRDVVFVPLERVRESYDRELVLMEPWERELAERVDADLTDSELELLRVRYVEGPAALVGPEGLRRTCWRGHEVGPKARPRGDSLYLEPSA